MITQYDVMYCLKDELPQLADVISPARIASGIYTSIQRLSDFTKENLKKHHLHIVDKCFCLAEKFYKEGDDVVKKAVENIFIDSLYSFLKVHFREETLVHSIIPANLFGLYLKRKRALAN